MTLPIERARSRRPITWLTLLGVLLLPALIGGILVIALQNPTSRLDSMTAAVVNLDKPVTIDGQYTPLGRQLAAGLVDGSDEMDSNLTWVISNEEDAAQGLGDGTYQAVVTIPESFSADATSAGVALQDGAGSPEQAKITVTTPPDGRIADGLITQQLATTAASTMGTMLSEATIGNVLVGFTTIGDQIGEAADGAVKLADGARSAADGAAALPDGASQLASGADGLADGANQLAVGLTTISSKSREAGDGANQLGAGLTAGAAQLERDGLIPAQLTDALNQGTGAAKTAAETAGLAATAADGARQAADGAAQAAGGAQQYANGVKQGLDQVVPGLQGLSQQCDAAAQPEFCAQLAALAQGADDLRAPAGSAAELAGTASQTAGKAAEAAGGAKQAADGAQQAAAGAQQASAGVAAGLAEFDKKAPAEIASQMRTAGQAASQLGSGLGQLADGVATSATGASSLSSGATQLGDGASALADGAGELVGGLDTLASGTGDLADGLQTASTSLPSFDEQQSNRLASVVSDPVKASADSNDMFGPTAIPLLAAVVLWFGALASFIALRAVPGSALTSRRSSIAMVLRGFWPAAVIGAGQGLLVALIVQIVADYDAGTWWGFAGFTVLAGISFAAVNQALVALFGGIGRWVSALVGVVAVATGLISTIPSWLAGLGAAMPTAPALGGLIAPNGSAFAGLVVWGTLALGAATLAVATRRTASAKTVLATA